jgi:hypothetical protein
VAAAVAVLTAIHPVLAALAAAVLALILLMLLDQERQILVVAVVGRGTPDQAVLVL